jgi:hypothetical protein
MRPDHVADRLVTLQDAQQHLVEDPGLVGLGGALEVVGEAEAVEKRPKPGVHVVAVALMRAERIGDRRQRPLQEGLDLLRMGDVVRQLSQPIHVVGEGVEPGRDVREPLEGTADERGPEDLGEGADMRQAGWTIAGLEEDEPLLGRTLLDTIQKCCGLGDGPCLALAKRRPVHFRSQTCRETAGTSGLGAAF